ncbi:hypothetical protein CRE_00950 [Caenorhabditis remanei]|uniref:Vitellogenin domain-containing protein n=1 Tax=Caenorhabditis remanei TaxID=31234 RepID=E3LD15_CAERE|nr:hypothetical protein CRE_00950 [Caenorhabditis remanei]
MKSIIIAFLVALAISPASDRTFSPKSEYVYKFDGLILSGVPTTSSDTSQTRISCRTRIQVIDDRYIHLQLTDVTYSASHIPQTEQWPKMESLEQRELSDELRKFLELPIRVQMRNGLISEIQSSSEDAEWSKNEKRSIVNLLSLHRSAPVDELNQEEKDMETEKDSRFFNVYEKTMESCKVDQSEVSAFENITYSAPPLTTGFSLVSKDFSEQPTFAVSSKKINKNNDDYWPRCLQCRSSLGDVAAVSSELKLHIHSFYVQILTPTISNVAALWHFGCKLNSINWRLCTTTADIVAKTINQIASKLFPKFSDKTASRHVGCSQILKICPDKVGIDREIGDSQRVGSRTLDLNLDIECTQGSRRCLDATCV